MLSMGRNNLSCPRVMTGRVRGFPNLAGRFGSCQEKAETLTGRNGSGDGVFKYHGPGHPAPTRPDPTRGRYPDPWEALEITVCSCEQHTTRELLRTNLSRVSKGEQDLKGVRCRV